MRQEIRTKLKERRESEINEQLAHLMEEVVSEGYSVTFGEIGQRTTYALLSKGDEEIVGYTFIKALEYKNPIVGKYKALQQALARKSILEQEGTETE